MNVRIGEHISISKLTKKQVKSKTVPYVIIYTAAMHHPMAILTF